MRLCRDTQGCGRANHIGSSGDHLPCFRRSSPPCRQPLSRANVWRSEPQRREAEPCKATFEGAARQARGSTSSMSAATTPSGARSAGSASGSNAGPRRVCPACGGELLRDRRTAPRDQGRLFVSQGLPGGSDPQAHHLGRTHLRSAHPPQPARVPAQGLAAGDRDEHPGIDACQLPVWSSASTSCRSWGRCSCRASTPPRSTPATPGFSSTAGCGVPVVSPPRRCTRSISSCIGPCATPSNGAICRSTSPAPPIRRELQPSTRNWRSGLRSSSTPSWTVSASSASTLCGAFWR